VESAARREVKLSRQERSIRWQAVSPSMTHNTVLSIRCGSEGEVGGVEDVDEEREGGETDRRRGSLRDATPLRASQPDEK